MKRIITVDIGRTSMGAILHGVDGRAMHMVQHENMVEFLNNGRVEQDRAAWQGVLLTVLKKCASAAETEGILPACASTTMKPRPSAPGSREPLPQNSKRVIQGHFPEPRRVAPQLPTNPIRHFEKFISDSVVACARSIRPWPRRHSWS
jgi:hypothetical protein